MFLKVGVSCYHRHRRLGWSELGWNQNAYTASVSKVEQEMGVQL